MAQPTPRAHHGQPGWQRLAPTAGAATAAAQASPDPAAADSIYFAPGSSSMNPAGRSKLKRLAQRLLADKRQVVTLIGHANDNGSASFNLAVADSRIGAVAAALKNWASPHTRSSARCAAMKKPADCRSSECRRAMRRVDLVFSQGGSNR
jgi:OOP family OmpA-OmpF porin